MIAALAASMGLSATDPAFWMPLLRMTLLLSLLLGAILFDGFDIGVGLLLPSAPLAARPALMVALSPWRDANEFWALLAVGLFMSAFPFAWSAMLSHLYVPLAFTMIGVMLRSVAFEFRIRAATEDRWAWIWLFWLGSVLTAAGHGMLLAAIVTGYEEDAPAFWFNLFIAICAIASYALLGATWLVMKTEGDIQKRAYQMAWRAGGITVAAIVAVSGATPFLAGNYWQRWFTFPSILATAQVPLVVAILTAALVWTLKTHKERWPFLLTLGIYALCFMGLGISIYPDIVPGRVSIWEAASPPASQGFMLIGAGILIPIILTYTGYAYWVFRGKVHEAGYH